MRHEKQKQQTLLILKKRPEARRTPQVSRQIGLFLNWCCEAFCTETLNPWGCDKAQEKNSAGAH